MVTGQAVQLPGSEVHVLRSDAVGDEFEISIFAPAPEVDGPVPVIYATDANSTVGIMAGTLPGLVVGGEIPPVLLVCIGYPIGGDFTQFMRLRTRDFTPTADPVQQASTAAFAGLDEVFPSGGADAFLEFLTTELRPWIAANYAVSDDSTLIGDSQGGLFATYTLLHQPSAFTRYVIGSPWLCWNREVTTAYEAQYAEAHSDLDATVFLAAGADEDVLAPGLPEPMAAPFRNADTAELTRQLAAGLESRGYPSLRLTTRILPEVTHFTMVPILVAMGLRAVFEAERLA